YVLRQGHLGGIGGEVYRKKLCLSFGGSAAHGTIVYLACTARVRAVRVDPPRTLHLLWRAAQSRARSPAIRGAVATSRRPAPGIRADAREAPLGRDQPIRHTGDLRQHGARAYPHRRGLRPGLLSPERRTVLGHKAPRGHFREDWCASPRTLVALLQRDYPR